MVPIVDGVPLDRLIASFEKARVFDVVGGYGGLVVDSFNFGDLGTYFLGAIDSLDLPLWPLLLRPSAT